MEYIVNNKMYLVVRLLGHGKGGYSYLVKDKDENLYVLKQIHHEPCTYYSFGNKLESEINDYNKLNKIGIRMPILYEVDIEKEIIIKEYIDGYTINEIILKDQMKDIYLNQMKYMCDLLYSNSLNIDYYPTNFVVSDNQYMEKWNFENWGVKYWSKTEDFMKAFSK